MKVRPIDDRDLLHTYLSSDRVGCVYQLGYLDDAYDSWCRWWGAFDSDETLKFVLLEYTGLSVPVVLTVGDGDAAAVAFQGLYGELPDRFYCHLREEHLEPFRKHYNTAGLKSTLRMSLDRSRYTRVDADSSVVRLGHRDTGSMMRLYDHYPDNFFEPYQLESGLYFGIPLNAGADILCSAGIHVLSELHDVAVLGNLVTHPSHRGKNLAVRVVGRLLNELFERVSLVGLNVSADNTPAQRTLERFRFRPEHSFWEGLAKRAF